MCKSEAIDGTCKIASRTNVDTLLRHREELGSGHVISVAASPSWIDDGCMLALILSAGVSRRTLVVGGPAPDGHRRERCNLVRGPSPSPDDLVPPRMALPGRFRPRGGGSASCCGP